MNIVNHQTEVKIKVVRELRHFGVHYSQRFDKELIEITRKILQPSDLRGWITKADASQSLMLSASILNHFISTAETQASSAS